MKSMTGYGHSVFRSEGYTVEAEIKSYNNRYLDIVTNISPLLSSFEAYSLSRIKEVCTRGHVELSLKLAVLKSDAIISIDRCLMEKYHDAFSVLEKDLGVKASLSDYLSVQGILSSDRIIDQDSFRDGVETVLSQSLEMLAFSKDREGEGTRSDLARLGERFNCSLMAIDSKASELSSYFSSVLKSKYEELTGEKDKDDPRFMTEVAALLVKYSINEEVERLKVHIAEYRRLIALDEPVGKRLDFLCQEMNRECNTIASKSQLVDINLLVVDMKDNLENIREQIRNIE